MHQLAELDTGGTDSTGIIRLRIRTTDVLRIGNGKGQFPCSGRTEKQLGMTDPLIFHRPDQFFLHLLLSKYLFELHKGMSGFASDKFSKRFGVTTRLLLCE
jgi:hypothetical protein